MHRRQKSAIQTHRREIVDDLFLEEDLLVKMTREKLFTNGMIEDIKVGVYDIIDEHARLFFLPTRLTFGLLFNDQTIILP